jgi:hypothetical protein
MTVLTKRLAAVAAGAVPSMGVFGPKRAGDRLAGSKRARFEQSGPSFADPTRNADSSTTLWIWTFILASVGFVVLAVLLFWTIGGFGELGLSGKGLVALRLGFLFTAGLAIGLMALVFFSDRSGRDDETSRAAKR